MYDNDGKGHLPHADEVLVCSGNVSTEQVCSYLYTLLFGHLPCKLPMLSIVNL